MMSKLNYVFLLALIVLTASCDSIPEATVLKAERTKKQIGYAKKEVKKNDSLFQIYAKKMSVGVSSYVKREKLNTHFDIAEETLRLADTFYKHKVDPILELNESASEAKLLNNLKTVDNKITSAITSSEYPKKRLTLINQIEKDVDKYKNFADNALSVANGDVQSIKVFAKTYYKNYPKRKKDIDTDIAESDKLLKSIKSNNDSITKHYELKKGGEDYNLTILANSYNGIKKDLQELLEYNKAVKSHLRELDGSYTKVLKDIKVQFYVQVGRTSWDDYSDYNTDKNYVYPIKEVTENVYKYFEKLPGNTVLAYGTNGFNGHRVNVRIDKTMWNSLKINIAQNYPSGHDDSEFWVNNVVAKYYHKYVVERNGRVIENNKWELVDEDTFYDNLENLGMSIYSKPRGYFEAEAIEEAAPAGMSYVGNSKYGEWKKDSNGNDFWSFYGKYMFFSNMLGGHNYSRYEYDDYNRNYRYRDRNYYGSRGQHRYGTRGSQYARSNYYKSSNYRRSYASNSRSEFGHGNLRKTYRPSRASSVSTRGRSTAKSTRAGRSRRGGGPGGGGK
jgi:hypothetical protein